MKFRFFSKISEIVSFDRNSVLKNFSWVFRDLIKEMVLLKFQRKKVENGFSRKLILTCSSLGLKNTFLEAKLCQYCDKGQGQILTNAGASSRSDSALGSEDYEYDPA